MWVMRFPIRVGVNKNSKGNTMELMTESAVRSLAKRRGFVMHKSRSRNPESPDYGGFMLANSSNVLVIGRDYSETLEDIQDWLTNPDTAEVPTT
jgi:hypothetical protein